MYETLRRLCREHPEHKHYNEVSAKLWIIARTYATQIERKVSSDGSQGSSLATIAETLLKHGEEIDELLNHVSANAERLCDDLLPSIFRVHGALVQLLKPITGGSNVRSFASKYLHFHRPAVPIYDSVALSNLRKLVRWTPDLECDASAPEGDDEYRWFVLRLRRLNQRARSEGLDPTVRDLDWYLLSAGDAPAAPVT
ncbi:MAG: hypothetical protein U1E23_01645 [Reyranellaceae bacterium]